MRVRIRLAGFLRAAANRLHPAPAGRNVYRPAPNGRLPHVPTVPAVINLQAANVDLAMRELAARQAMTAMSYTGRYTGR